MRTKCIVGGDIITPLETIPRGTILIEGSRIAALGPGHEITLPADCDVVDAEGYRVLPGLVDLHVHGLMSIEVMDEDAPTIPLQLARYGVTSFQATILAAPLDVMAQAIASVAALNNATGARLVGIHLEGPFLSPARPGALQRKHFRMPNVAELASLVAAGDGTVRMVTLAPELPGALDLVSWLVAEGIVAAVGHSEASFEEVNRAADLGLSYATHTFNAMSGFHHREPGVVGAILTNDSIVAEVIGDGVHVHPAVVSLLLRAKGPSNVCLASDASPLTGMPSGTYTWLGQKVQVDERSARLASGSLAGGALLLNRQLAFLEKTLGNDPTYGQLVETATLTPSGVLGLDSGLLAVGGRADIAVLDGQHRCRLAMVGGEIVYSA